MYYLGIDLGGTNIKAGICDENGKIIIKASTKTEVDKGVETILQNMASIGLEVVEKAGITINDLEYAGIATPGTADNEAGTVVYCSSIPFLNYPLAKRFSELTGIKKVYIENDANAAAKGEAVVGVAKDYNNSIMITLGTGVGGGIVLQNQVYTGFNFAAAELGHIVIDFGGPPCPCGRRGCWEQLSSATALVRMTKEAMEADKASLMWELCGGDIEKADARTSFDAKRKGDKAGTEVVSQFIKYLACGIVNIINIFQPEIICIGGGVCNEGDYLLNPLMEIINKEQYSRHSIDKTRIAIAQLGNDAGIIGAAMLGR